MKRMMALLLAVSFLFTLTACGGGGNADTDVNATTTTVGGDVIDTTTTTVGDGTDTSDSVDSGNSVSNTTASKTSTNNNSQSSDSGIKMNVTIKNGTTRVEQGLDFGGKTFKYALGISLTESGQRMVAKFQNQYNCKIETSLFGFQTYVQEVAARNAAGEVFDILQVEGIRFPSIAIANLAMPLEDVITSADWYNSSASANGGFDQELTNNFVWNNHLYAVTPQSGPYSPQMMVLFYNKKIVKELGLTDPRTLYEQGKWDWDAFYNLGTELVKNGVYLADRYTTNYVTNWNNAQIVDTSDPAHPKANIADSNHINAFKFMQKLTLGQNKVVDPNLAGTDETPSLFLQGKTAMWYGFYFDLYENYKLGESVSASNYFGKNVSNLGIVPGPFGPDNTEKAHTVGSFVYGIGVGVGSSNPKVAMAFAKFSSTSYTSNVGGKYTYSTEDLALIKSMTDGPKNYTGSSYSDGSNTLTGLRGQVCYKIAFGDDIAQTVNSYNVKLQNCIDVTIKQQ